MGRIGTTPGARGARDTRDRRYETVSIHYDENDASQPRPEPRHEFPVQEEFERFLRHADERLADHEEASSLRIWTDLAEAWRIAGALRECRGNRTQAARQLGIGRRTLYAKMEKLRMTPSWRI
jgi:DNA-binding NtrC family response regulator